MSELALKFMETQNIGIVILDLNLPGIDGIESLEKLRRRNRKVQAIILTGFGDLEAAKKAIHLDVVEFLTKPCTLGSLEVALARARARRKGQFVNEASAAPEPVLQFGPDTRAEPAFARELAAASAAPGAV